MVQVSVVIPAYNAALYLPEAISSILDQSFKDFELIVIDDASKDETWSIIQSFASKDSRIRAFRNENNLGIAGNRNRGLELATGKYLAWQDADDISVPTRLEKQHSYLEAHPEAGMVGGALQLFRGDKVLGIRRYPTTDEELRKCIFRHSPVAQPSAMLRIEALKKVGSYNLKYPPAEDLEMTFRIGEHFRLANLDEILVKYRESSTSATFRSLRKIELSSIEIRWKFAKSNSYHRSVGDLVYNIAHFISIWIIPPNLKIWMFKFLRDSKAS